jgi:hypothetical protein
MEHSYVTASKSAVDVNLKLIDMAEETINSAFEFARQVPEIKSPSAFFELSAAHTRKQFETLTKQTQHLTGLAQQAVTETVQSWQTVAKTFAPDARAMLAARPPMRKAS